MAPYDMAISVPEESLITAETAAQSDVVRSRPSCGTDKEIPGSCCECVILTCG